MTSQQPTDWYCVQVLSRPSHWPRLVPRGRPRMDANSGESRRDGDWFAFWRYALGRNERVFLYTISADIKSRWFESGSSDTAWERVVSLCPNVLRGRCVDEVIGDRLIWSDFEVNCHSLNNLICWSFDLSEASLHLAYDFLNVLK